MKSCIPKHVSQQFIKDLDSGKIKANQFTNMDSEQRREAFTKIFGDKNAQWINALYESKLLLKDQKKGLQNWVEDVGNLKPEVRRDLLSRIGRIESAMTPSESEYFHQDFVAQRLGFNVTQEEAGKLVDMSNAVRERYQKIDRKSPDRSDSRIEYGTAVVAFENYVRELKLKGEGGFWSNALNNPYQFLLDLSGSFKVAVASIDQSFYGRQAWITLMTNPKTWVRNFGKAMGELGQNLQKRFKNVTILDAAQADVFSRENALNGKYKAMKLDIGLASEEAFPTPVLEKIKGLGRLYKFSSQSYTAAAIRFRADWADQLIEHMEMQGIDTLGNPELEHVGNYIGTLTGRRRMRDIGPGLAKFTNALLFSPKFVWSQIRYLADAVPYTTQIFYKPKAILKPTTPLEFKRKLAFTNLAKFVGMAHMLMFLSWLFDEDSVEWDPRSSDYGKILLGDERNIKISVMGALGPLITLTSRLWTQEYVTRRGRKVSMQGGEFGKRVGIDFVAGFFMNKFAPVVAPVANYYLRGNKNFAGEKQTFETIVKGATLPINIQNLWKMIERGDEEGLNILHYILYSAASTLGILSIHEEESKIRR